MAYSKVGFLAGVGGNPTGIGVYVSSLHNAGIPAVVMCNDGDVGISDALNTGGDHVMVFRVVRDGSEQYAVPDYNLTPAAAAVKHWQLIRPFFHPNVVANKDKVWVQPVNEVDKNRADWLGNFGVEIAEIAAAEGFKVCLFAFSSGEPEPGHWLAPGMVAYLNYCAAHKEMAAVALHEYDLYLTGMAQTYPWHIGRFEELYRTCDDLGIERPYVLITEFGWQRDNVPSQAQCLIDVDFASLVYSQFPNVLGAAIWYLGKYQDTGIANKVQPLIAPVTNHILTTTYPDPEVPPMETWRQEAWRVSIERQTISLNPQAALQSKILPVGQDFFTPVESEFYLTAQEDNIQRAFQAAENVKTAERRLYYAVVPNWSNVQWFNDPDTAAPFAFEAYPVRNRPYKVTSPFNAPRPSYPPTTNQKHEGIDLYAPEGSTLDSVADGVVEAVDKVGNGPLGLWVFVRHSERYATKYGHMSAITVSQGQTVTAGQKLGLSGNTGNSTGPHLHLTLDDKQGLSGYYYSGKVADPTPFLDAVGVPPAVDVDLLPYVRGDGRLYEVKNSTGSQERFQSQDGAGTVFYQTKNSQWEEMWVNTTHIVRDRDTSPGGGRYYRMLDPDNHGNFGRAWIPRYWQVGGEDFSRSAYVQFYNKADCSPVPENSGNVTDTMRFVAMYPSYTFRTGIVLNDVIELLWVNGKERYFYARGFGLVAWERQNQDPNTPQWSAISEIHQPGTRPDNVRETGCFSQ